MLGKEKGKRKERKERISLFFFLLLKDLFDFDTSVISV